MTEENKLTLSFGLSFTLFIVLVCINYPDLSIVEIFTDIPLTNLLILYITSYLVIIIITIIIALLKFKGD